jgi:hypothetical protein
MVFRLKQSSGFSEIPILVQIGLMPMVKGFVELASGAFRRKTRPGRTPGGHAVDQDGRRGVTVR